MEGKSKTSLMSLGSKEYRSEGKGDQKFEPRITRRMSKVKMSTEGTQGKCVICLGNYEEDRGTLECGHTFCKDCLIRWWRNHSNCPFCRQEILFITTKQGIIEFQSLPKEEKEEKDQFFIPHCELCWGEIEESEEMNICTYCRSVYWHRRCLPFASYRWYCMECAGEQEEESDGTL